MGPVRGRIVVFMTNSTDTRTSTIALVTGGNKGIGRETVRRLAALGWTVYLGSRDPERGKAAAAELGADGADVRFLPLDVTSDESVAEAARTVTAETGRLDVLVNNAGVVGAGAAAEDTEISDFVTVYGVNVLGPVRTTQAFLPLLRASEEPRIVMVSSGMGSITRTSDPELLESTFATLVYTSSKSALNMITSQYARALPGFRVNAADPGYTATDFNNHQGHQTVEEGAEASVALATVGPDGPTGGYFDRFGPIPW